MYLHLLYFNTIYKGVSPMKLYASYGTYAFLKQKKDKNPDHSLYLFSTADNSVIIEETEDRTVLKEPIAYEEIKSDGAIDERHFHAVIFIPTTEDHAYQLEKKLESLTANYSQFAGYRCYRFLKPTKQLTYKIYFGFNSRNDYETFKNSSVFKENFSREALSQFFGSSTQYASYFERYLYPITDED